MKEKFNKIITNLKRNKFFHNIYEKWKDIHTIMLFFIICFGILIWKLFSYTIFDYKFYTDLADKQQIGTFSVPINRGLILSSIERDGKNKESGYLATSINLYDLAIDPQEIGDKNKLGEYLINLIYSEICQGKTTKKCKNNLLKFLRVLELEDFENTSQYIKKAIGEKVIPRINKKNITNTLLGNNFTNTQISKINSLNIKGVYTKNNSISINPEEFEQTEANLTNISEILFIDKERLKTITRKRLIRYVKIYDKLSINSSEEVKNLIKEEKDAINKGILEVENSIYKFFITEENPSRYYPEGDIGSQIIGFTDNSGVGQYGLEGYFNDILKGNNGKIVARKDANGRIINTIDIEKEALFGEGIQIVTTIDRNIQKKVEEILENGVKKYRANKGTIVVTEPKTGKIIAMANYPNYDLNHFGDVMEIEKVSKSKYPNPSIDLLGLPVFVVDSENGEKYIYDNKEIILRKATIEELGNPALVKYKFKNDFGNGVYVNDTISSLYEPGSIMKAITVAIGLDTGEITAKSRYEDKGSVKIDNFEIKNESDKCLGYNTFGHALDYSCNVGMIRIFQRVGKALVAEYLENFGFGEKTNIELLGENFATLGAWEKWSKANLFTKSYGLGISVTPIQMASAYNILANGGVYVKPKIVDKIIYPNGKVIEYKTEQIRRVIKESTSETITKMLYNGIENGLAKKGKVDGYSLAGKTGTAQILYNGKYQSGAGWTNASYAGYGPIENPKFVIIIKLERPRTNEYGSATSGELFSQVASYLLDYYGIPKSKK